MAPGCAAFMKLCSAQPAMKPIPIRVSMRSIWRMMRTSKSYHTSTTEQGSIKNALIFEYRAMSVSHYVTQLSEPVKHGIDYFAVGAFVMSLLTNVMPVLTALLTAVWIVLRIVEARENIRLAKAKRREIE